MPYPHHLQAGSVEEAVNLAKTLCQQGEYNILRGQSVDWPMRPSLARRDATAQAESKKRLLNFARFVESTPELAELWGNRNAVFGIAQHYGIPTFFVDFTTDPDVAGWFASHYRPEGSDRPGIIYLAHEDYIEQQYRDRLPQLRTVRIDVDHLWRLQAQSGLFLEMPFPDDPELDVWLAEAFGTIRFPHTGPLDSIPEKAIYPDRKSRLEILFDAYLSEERSRRVHQAWQAMGFNVVRADLEEERRRADSLVGGFVPDPHSSWQGPDANAWSHHPPERFRRQDDRPQVVLEVREQDLDGSDPGQVQRRWRTELETFLRSHREVRGGFLEFQLRLPGSGRSLNDCVHRDSPIRRTVGQDLADCFDGMRLYPYSDEVIADAITLVAAVWAHLHGAGRDFSTTIRLLLGDSVLIEMGLVEGGQFCQTIIPKADITRALRDDLRDLLLPQFQDWVNHPDRLMHQVNEPRRLFDFRRFVDLFGRRAVPGQFLMRSREVVFFSPTRLDRFNCR